MFSLRITSPYVDLFHSEIPAVFQLRPKYSNVLCAVARMATNLMLEYVQDEACGREGPEGKVFAVLILLDEAELDLNTL